MPMDELPSGIETAVDVEIDDETGATTEAGNKPADTTPAERTGSGAANAATDDDDDEGHSDEVPDNATDDERNDIRTRRREERTRRKNAAKARDEGQRRLIEQQAQTIEQLAGRVAAVERSGLSTHINHVDAAIRDTDERLQAASLEHATAVSLGDGTAAAAAMEAMMDLRIRKIQLDGNKRQLAQAVQNQQRAPVGVPQPQQATPMAPAVATRVQAFHERHKGWYNPASGSAESKIVLAVDQEVAEAGFDPSTDDYWAEVESRLKNYLPHRIVAAHNGARSEGNSMPKTPVSGGARSQAAGSRGGKVVYTLSAERVAAMKESGAWDDPVRKAEQIKRFRAYDADKAKGGE